MLIMGIAGGVMAPYEDDFLPTNVFHDASAVLVRDGKVIVGTEEERINRIKHTNKLPAGAVRFCLESGGVRLEDVDYFAYYSTPHRLDANVRHFNLQNLHEPDQVQDFSAYFRGCLARQLGEMIDPSRFVYVDHHLTHAVSAFAPSGFERALVLTIDGEGDDSSGLVIHAQGGSMTTLRSHTVADSLGYFYLDMIRFIGFADNEEYKVMGLAPYGDASRFSSLFSSFYELQPEGRYTIRKDRFNQVLSVLRQRKRFEPLEQVHKDFAAGLQQALETIVFHVARHFRQVTGERKLCLAGGVAQNCTLNGKLLASGLFDEVFVQPVAYDAGCALGAALHIQMQKAPGVKIAPLEDLYWGRHIGESSGIEATLREWEGLVEFERVEDVSDKAAELLAAGRVIGWAQGRSEFGPRALGNRSILADPRPAENKEIINAMVKKREGFRPFAPSVLEEHAHEYFEFPENTQGLPFMIFVVPVRPDKRSLLGAITHVDGTARIQTVSRDTNPRYWQLIHRFQARTGVPLVLNTSFNNNVEPIVDTVEDAVVCFLTTRLHHLVVGDYVVSKKPRSLAQLEALRVSLPAHVKLRMTRQVASPGGEPETRFVLANTYNSSEFPVSEHLFGLLTRADGHQTLGQLRGPPLEGEQAEAWMKDLEDLWSRRLVRLSPASKEVGS